MAMPRSLPVLEARRVRLRGFEYRDVPLVREASTGPPIPRGTTVPDTAGTGEARAYVDRQTGRVAEGLGYSFAIADPATDEAVGQIGLWLHEVRDGRASIGYWVGPRHRRRGWATNALRAISSWGLDLPELQRLELYVEPWNSASWRAAERTGYLREGLLRSWQSVGGVRRDMYMYSRLPEGELDQPGMLPVEP